MRLNPRGFGFAGMYRKMEKRREKRKIQYLCVTLTSILFRKQSLPEHLLIHDYSERKIGKCRRA
jgi:hypothetical protein